MKRWLLAALCALLLVAPGGALAEPASPTTPTFTADTYPVVDGSTATLPLSYAVMSKLCNIPPEEAKARIRHTKTSESFYALVQGQADVLLVYQPSQEALDFARDENVELEMQPLGKDALVFLCNDSNPIASLTQAQIVDIYTGKVANWSDLGGADEPIVAYQRVAASGSQVMMEKLAMKGVKMMDAPSELMPGEMSGLIDRVSDYKNEGNALGYSVYYYVHNMYMQPGIRVMDIDGVTPTNESIGAGLYPYVQDFYVVIRKDTPEGAPARRLFDWLLSVDGQKLVEESGYVPAMLPAADPNAVVTPGPTAAQEEAATPAPAPAQTPQAQPAATVKPQ